MIRYQGSSLLMLLSLLLFAVLTILVLIAPVDMLTKLVGDSYSMLIPSVGTVSSTLGGIYIAAYFLTAQIRPQGIGNAAIGVLYKDLSPYSVTISVGTSLATAFYAILEGVAPAMIARSVLISILLVCHVAANLTKVAALQLGNLNKVFLASRVLSDYTVRSVEKYGLVSIARRGVSGPSVNCWPGLKKFFEQNLMQVSGKVGSYCQPSESSIYAWILSIPSTAVGFRVFSGLYSGGLVRSVIIDRTHYK